MNEKKKEWLSIIFSDSVDAIYTSFTQHVFTEFLLHMGHYFRHQNFSMSNIDQL